MCRCTGIQVYMYTDKQVYRYTYTHVYIYIQVCVCLHSESSTLLYICANLSTVCTEVAPR
jgi:hypothetical protein